MLRGRMDPLATPFSANRIAFVYSQTHLPMLVHFLQTEKETVALWSIPLPDFHFHQIGTEGRRKKNDLFSVNSVYRVAQGAMPTDECPIL